MNHKPMNQFQVPGFIAGKLPEIRYDLAISHTNGNIYQSIQILTDYTKRMAIEHNFKMVEKCMSIVEKIYGKATP